MSQRKSTQQKEFEIQAQPVSEKMETTVNDLNSKILDYKKVEQVIGRIKQQSKLYRVGEVDRFNKYFEAHKQLSTFVDYSKRMKNANVLNNHQLLSEIKQYQDRKNLYAIVGPQNVQQIDDQKDKLFEELDYEQERQYIPFDPSGQLKLSFGHLTQIINSKTPTIKIADYVIAKETLKKASQPLNDKKTTLPRLDVEQLLEKMRIAPDQQQINYEDNYFYSRVETNYANVEEKIYQKQKVINASQNPLQDQIKQTLIDEKLQKLAEHYGIDQEENQKVTKKERMYGIYQKKSNQLVGQVIEESKRKHLVYLKKINKEKIEQDQMRQNRQKQKGLKVQLIINPDDTLKRHTSLYAQSQTQSNSQQQQFQSQFQSQSQTQIKTLEVSQQKSDKQIDPDKSSNYFLSDLQSPQTMSIKKSSSISFFSNQRNSRSQINLENPQKLIMSRFQGKLKSLQSSMKRDELQNNIERDDLELQIQRMQCNILRMFDRVDFDDKKTIYGFNEEKLQPKKEEESSYKKIQKRSFKRSMKIIRNE